MLQKWNRLYNLFHPRPEIGKDEAGPLCLVNGPRLAYGWAFSRSDIRKYADFHHVNMPLQEYLSEKLGKTLVRYGALSETDAQDEELLFYLDECVEVAVRVHLEYVSGVDSLRRVLPFGNPRIFDVCFALYTNIEAEERMEEIDATTGLDDAITIINYAIKEAGVQSELLWWYDRAGLRGVVRPLPYSVQFFLLSPITQGLNYPC